tara:strand:- start:458 stop:1333 length:876 start_codon:yes stop_codon:yes gene_type:complete
MSFKLRLKSYLFQILENFPEKLGDRLYHSIQIASNGKDVKSKMSANYNTYLTFKEITEKLGISISGKKIIEIGSGWLPIMPYFFKYLGQIELVESYDLNEHYNKNSILNLNELFQKEFNVNVLPSNSNNFFLPESLKYHPKTNLVSAKLPAANLVFSRFVLEHVTPEDIKEMHLKFIKELPPRSYIIHFISPGDHRAYVDKTLSLQDFLKYSDADWEKKHTRFDYHNRLRLPQYVDIFSAIGLEIVYLDYSNPSFESEAFKNFKQLKLHKDFEIFTDEELTAGAINIVLKT